MKWKTHFTHRLLHTRQYSLTFSFTRLDRCLRNQPLTWNFSRIHGCVSIQSEVPQASPKITNDKPLTQKPSKPYMGLSIYGTLAIPKWSSFIGQLTIYRGTLLMDHCDAPTNQRSTTVESIGAFPAAQTHASKTANRPWHESRQKPIIRMTTSGLFSWLIIGRKINLKWSLPQ